MKSRQSPRLWVAGLRRSSKGLLTIPRPFDLGTKAANGELGAQELGYRGLQNVGVQCRLKF